MILFVGGNVLTACLCKKKSCRLACHWPLEEIHQAIIRLMDAEVVLVGVVSIRGTVFLPPSEPLDNLWTLDLCNLEVSVF